MSTYYLIANRTRREFISPHTLGGGACWGEWNTGRPAYLLTNLLCRHGYGAINSPWVGRWVGEAVEVVSDLGGPNDEYYEIAEGENGWTDITVPAWADCAEYWNALQEGRF